jgi:hypothetical protein
MTTFTRKIRGKGKVGSPFNHVPFHKLLCLYDGIKLRCNDEQYIDWLLQDEQREKFDFKITIDDETGAVSRYDGKYENFDIEIQQLGVWVVDISGSVHTWTNRGKHNYNDFYFADFLKVYDEMVDAFQFKPKTMRVVNLELGVNCILPFWIIFSSSEILDNVLGLFGSKCNSKKHIIDRDRDSFKVTSGERYLKIYDKAIQNKIKGGLMRLELGYSRSRVIKKYLNVEFFEDLRNISVFYKSKDRLWEAFQTLHMYQPDLLLNLPSSTAEADKDVFLYNKPSYWCKLKKANRYKYKKTRQKQEELAYKYCSTNLQQQLLTMLKEKLS